jgi:hypothetical protein
MPFSLNNIINRIQKIMPERESNYNCVFNIIFTAWQKKDFQTDRNLVKEKISDIMFCLKKGNNLKNLQIELEKFKCSDYDKDPVIFYFDCWIYTFNELMDFNLLELYGNGNYFIVDKYLIVDNPKEQKLVLVQFIECVLDLMANDMSIENEKIWIKIQKPQKREKKSKQKSKKSKYENISEKIPEKKNIFNSICRRFSMGF